MPHRTAAELSEKHNIRGSTELAPRRQGSQPARTNHSLEDEGGKITAQSDVLKHPFQSHQDALKHQQDLQTCLSNFDFG